MDRRQFMISAAASAALVAKPARAEDAYPTRAITIINPYPPGGVNELGDTGPCRQRSSR